MNPKDKINESTEYKKCCKPEKVPVMKDAGYPETGVKTSGIKQRGYGAATKGCTSRGPMG
jgi:hypothetical protein